MIPSPLCQIKKNPREGFQLLYRREFAIVGPKIFIEYQQIILTIGAEQKKTPLLEE
jgi:hypothetical protein